MIPTIERVNLDLYIKSIPQISNFHKLKFNLQVKFVRDSSDIKIFEQNIIIVALTYLLVQVKNNNSDKY